VVGGRQLLSLETGKRLVKVGRRGIPLHMFAKGLLYSTILVSVASVACSKPLPGCADDTAGCGGSGGSIAEAGGAAGSPSIEHDSAAFEGICGAATDCEPGMICLEEGGTAYFGGGPPAGRCTLDCLEDPTVCGDSGEVVCVRTEPAGEEPTAHCFPACSPGDGDDSKCQESALTACERLPDDPELGFCRPFCGSDDDCASGHCDRLNGVCASGSSAEDFGKSCEPDAEDPGCSGVCVALEDGFGVCSHRCRYGATEPCAGSDSSTFCAYPAEGSDFGDVGYCAELCDCQRECSHGDAVCDPFGSETVSMLLGAAGVCAVSTTVPEPLVCSE